MFTHPGVSGIGTKDLVSGGLLVRLGFFQPPWLFFCESKAIFAFSEEEKNGGGLIIEEFLKHPLVVPSLLCYLVG